MTTASSLRLTNVTVNQLATLCRQLIDIRVP